MKHSFSIVWCAGLGAVIIVWWLVWSNAKHFSSDLLNTPLNRVPSYGTAQYVTDIRIGWCNNDGKIIKSNLLTDALTITVFLQNFDRWLLGKGRSDQRLLPEDLKSDEFKNYLSLVMKRQSAKLSDDEGTELQSLQVKVNHWVLHERSNLRLTLAGEVFESIAPFDTTAAPTYGSKEFEGDTYNRIVFPLTAPNDAKELEKWRAIIRNAGPTFRGQISLARPIVAGGDALRLPTLVNADEIYTARAKPVYRSLPLVPPIRQGAAITAVVFTICAVLAAALGTVILRDERDPSLPPNQQPPWSLSSVVLTWWLTICVGCFAYLWALMGEYSNIISGSVPILLGLQGTTLVVATGFGRTKVSGPSQGFFKDLISDGGDPKIAKLQMLVWNFVLGIVFIWQSVFHWTMPTFDPILLALLGISSATYVGFKLVPK